MEAVVEQGVADGEMRTDDPRARGVGDRHAVRHVVDPFAERPPTMAKVIADTQRLARTLAGAPAG